MLPEGPYVLVASDEGQHGFSEPAEILVRAGDEVTLTLSVPPPATLRFRITDQQGFQMPVKLTLVGIDENDRPLRGDGRRRPYLGQGRRGNGVQTVHLSPSGDGELEVEPGRYGVIASRGPEYGVLSRVFDLTAGQVAQFEGIVPQEVDTTGWLSADMHLHATPSFDSGLPLTTRVLAAAAEGVEIAVSTDHDVSTDYRPTIRELQLEPMIKGVVGAEITTLEHGHFIGFPLAYDDLVVPTRGAHDWTCQPGQDIIRGIEATGDGQVDRPFTIVAHPRDGFFGYIDQLGVDTYSMNRSTSLLTEDNPVFRVAGCDFDAMEIISAKRYDLHRTPTIGEMVDWVRCLERVNRAADEAALATACPEVAPEGPIVPCDVGERFSSCRDRNRTELAWRMSQRILAREPAEQEADWRWGGSQAQTQELCDPASFGEDPVPEELRDLPCGFRPGQVDDFFRYLEHGLTPTQVGSSDSHGFSKEPGAPRTYVRTSSDAPNRVGVDEVVTSLRGGHAFATYGPFIRADIAGAT
ncbi:MAG: PHP domain-containing protein, partial [Myxococcota bacterium]